ncbi:uncharacterized protein [Anabrus simplex]|uniref:uncharacterized protein n=1 Tax=Anabrus simplex TaxID=316456 RepID=UPI0035A30832
MAAFRAYVGRQGLVAVDSVEGEKIIAEVRKHPEIWNLKCEDHQDKHKRQEAWRKICQVIIEDFDRRPEEERIEIGKKLTCRWRSIKDNYTRILRKKQSGEISPDGKEYVYARHLSFLDPVTRPGMRHWKPATARRRTTTSKRRLRPIRIKRSPAKQRTQDFETVFVNSAETVASYIEEDATPVQVTELAESAEDQNTVSVNTATHPDDSSFFDSLLPIIRNFNVDQKLEFRIEVLNLVRKIRMANTLYSYPEVFVPENALYTSSAGDQVPSQRTLLQIKTANSSASCSSFGDN